MNWFNGSICAAALVLGAAGAEAKILDCKIAVNAGHNGWVPDREVFDYNVEAGTATVLDTMTQTYSGGPIAVKVGGKTQKKVAFDWSVQMTSNTGKQVEMLYHAAFYNDNNKMVIRVTAPGYSDKYEARGVCKVK